MQHQMQMMQHMQGGGMMPPLDHFQQQQQSAYGVSVPQFPPPHIMALNPSPMNLMGQQQQFPQPQLMGMPPPQPNMSGHPQILQVLGAPPPQFRQPPAFQPPPLFPQQMQVAANQIQSDSNNLGHENLSSSADQ